MLRNLCYRVLKYIEIYFRIRINGLCRPNEFIILKLRDVELISVGIRRSNFGFSRVKKIKHSRATVHFFEEESIQKNKSKPGIYYFHVPKLTKILFVR